MKEKHRLVTKVTTPVPLSKKLLDFGNWTWDPTLPVPRKNSRKLCCFDLGPWWSKLESRAGYSSLWRLSSWQHKFTGLSPKRPFLELAMWGLRSSSRKLATFQKGTLGYSLFPVEAYGAMFLLLLILRNKNCTGEHQAGDSVQFKWNQSNDINSVWIETKKHNLPFALHQRRSQSELPTSINLRCLQKNLRYSNVAAPFLSLSEMEP
jgi:hypothetical protein